MAINPCPCMSLQKGCMALAILDAVIAMGNLGLMVLSLVFYIRYDKKDNPELTESERTVGFVVVIVLIILCILQVFLAFRLYYGSRNKDYRNCRIWLIITIISTVINTVNLILNITASDLLGTSFGGTLLTILYKLYEMLVVFFFLKQLKQEVSALDVRYTDTASQHSQPTPVYNISQQTQNTYPMQEYQPYPTPTHATSIVNQSYPGHSAPGYSAPSYPGPGYPAPGYPSPGYPEQQTATSRIIL